MNEEKPRFEIFAALHKFFLLWPPHLCFHGVVEVKTMLKQPVCIMTLKTTSGAEQYAAGMPFYAVNPGQIKG